MIYRSTQNLKDILPMMKFSKTHSFSYDKGCQRIFNFFLFHCAYPNYDSPRFQTAGVGEISGKNMNRKSDFNLKARNTLTSLVMTELVMVELELPYQLFTGSWQSHTAESIDLKILCLFSEIS